MNIQGGFCYKVQQRFFYNKVRFHIFFDLDFNILGLRFWIWFFGFRLDSLSHRQDGGAGDADDGDNFLDEEVKLAQKPVCFDVWTIDERWSRRNDSF